MSIRVADVDTNVFQLRDHESDLGDVVGAFDVIADALSADTDLDDLLHLLAERMCVMLGVARCAVYLRDDDSDLFRGRVAYPVRREADAWMTRSIAGTEADRFTREIVATKKPVLIANVRDDPRPMHGAMLNWGIHSMLGVPMLLHDEVVGLLFVDNGNVPHVYSETAQQLAAALANLSAVAVSQARRSAEMRDTLQTVVRQNRLLRQVSAMDDQLSRQVLDGASLEQIATRLASMTKHPCAIYDATCQELAVGLCSGEESIPHLMDEAVRSAPEIAAALSELQPDQPRVIGPAPACGLRRRHLVARVDGCGGLAGYVVLMDHRRNLTTFDAMLARRAATIVALTLSAERRALDADAHARESLVRDLLRGLDERGSLARRAAFHQLDLETHHVVCLLMPRDVDLDAPGDRVPTVTDVRAALQRGGWLETPFCAADDHGVALLLELPCETSARAGVAAAKEIARAVAAQLAPDGSVIAAVSPVCRGIADYPRAFTECLQLIQCMTTLLADPTVTVLATDDLGTGRLLLSCASPEMVERFALDAAGALLESGHDRAQLLATLAAFCDCNRNVRATGIFLGIHENTVRYRLGKIAELTGLELTGNAEDQLTAQFAVLVFRLRGRLAPRRARPEETAVAPVVG